MSKNDNQGSSQLQEEQEEILKTVSEVADFLNESPHVIRNWRKELKEYIPVVTKGSNNYNYYAEEGIKALSKIQKMSREQGYSIKQIKYHLATGQDPWKMDDMPPETEHIIIQKLESMEEAMKQQEEDMERQRQFHKLLLEKLDKQDQYIKNSLDNRDRRLMEHINNMQQAQIESAATKKEGFFSKLFKKER